MKNNFRKILLFLFILFFTNNLSAEVVKKIVVKGNERISDETVVVYGDIEVNKNYTQEDIDIVLKKLYETKFFSKVSINFSLGVLNTPSSLTIVHLMLSILHSFTKKL